MSSVIGINRLASSTNSFHTNGSQKLSSENEIGSSGKGQDPPQPQHLRDDEDMESVDDNGNMENGKLHRFL